MPAESNQRKEASSGQPSGLEAVDRFRVAHLATADAHGKPLVVPVCFACSGGSIYSVVDEKPKRVPGARLRRLKNIAENPQVCLLVDQYEEDWSRLAYIIVEGTAEVLPEGPEGTERTARTERPTALRLLRRKYPQYRAMQLEDKPVIKIAPSRVISWQAS